MNLNSIMQQLQAAHGATGRPRTLAATSGSGATGAPAASAQGGSTITANDFLTLLVSELKNQDPTANTDPNAYITQLVQVNSLQQLISINGDLGTPASSSGTGGSSPSVVAAAKDRKVPAGTAVSANHPAPTLPAPVIGMPEASAAAPDVVMRAFRASAAGQMPGSSK